MALAPRGPKWQAGTIGEDAVFSLEALEAMIDAELRRMEQPGYYRPRPAVLPFVHPETA